MGFIRLRRTEVISTTSAFPLHVVAATRLCIIAGWKFCEAIWRFQEKRLVNPTSPALTREFGVCLKSTATNFKELHPEHGHGLKPRGSFIPPPLLIVQGQFACPSRQGFTNRAPQSFNVQVLGGQACVKGRDMRRQIEFDFAH